MHTMNIFRKQLVCFARKYEKFNMWPCRVQVFPISIHIKVEYV